MKQNAPPARLQGLRLGLAASGLAFGTYFCMYAFRKPFTAASYAGPPIFGLDPKTLFVISQIVGYTASKYLGIKWVSEVPRHGRKVAIIGLIAAAELALFAFAVLPPRLKALALVANGLPLGMIWGLTVRYLEGRRQSELMLSALSCSFILASGAVKDVGRWLLSLGVSEAYMPALTGLAFFPALVLFARGLDRMPDPTERDEAEREPRRPMHRAARRRFASQHWPGLTLLLASYLLLTAYRDFRDNYGIEIFAELGYLGEPAIFSRTELPVALLVLVLLAGLSAFRDRIAGLSAVLSIMLAGLALVGLATLALDARWLGGQTWMICIGLGTYLAYVPFSSFLFDRIMAATRFAGTAVFAVNLADAIGYTGSIGMQLYKDLFAREATRLGFFRELSYALSLGGGALLCAAGAYFIVRARRRQVV